MNVSKVIIDLFEAGTGSIYVSKTLGIPIHTIKEVYTKEAKNFISVNRSDYEWTIPN